MPTSPPTTPPTIAPVLDFEDDVDDAEDAVEVELAWSAENDDTLATDAVDITEADDTLAFPATKVAFAIAFTLLHISSGTGRYDHGGKAVPEGTGRGYISY